MFGSNALEIIIGLSFFYLLLSLVCSTINELLEAAWKSRAQDLEKGLREFFGSASSDTTSSFVQKIYGHGLVNCLFHGSYSDQPEKRNLPSYIPSKNFTLAMIATVKECAQKGTALPPNVITALNAFGKTFSSVDPADASKVQAESIKLAADIDKYKSEIEAWYNTAMDRIAGGYKRRSQRAIFIIGFLAVIIINVDTFQVVQRLSDDASLRNCVVAAAQTKVKDEKLLKLSGNGADDFKAAKDNIDKIGFPIGWHVQETAIAPGDPKSDAAKDVDTLPDVLHDPESIATLPGIVGKALLVHIWGWLVTAIAVSLGAPFWFDVLNKFIVIRSTVKPHEKSQEEASKDA